MKILFLENHATFARTVVRQFLSQHTVTVVPSLAAAREALAREVFDAILADYDVDDGKGDALVRECRAKSPILPIIAVSSHEKGNTALLVAGASAVCDKMNFGRIGDVLQAWHPAQ